jgi:hypothetical protein
LHKQLGTPPLKPKLKMKVDPKMVLVKERRERRDKIVIA